MKTILTTLSLLVTFWSPCSYADPMGLSDYVVYETYSTSTGKQDSGSHTAHERRLTNHEVDVYKAAGFINADGSISPKANTLRRDPIITAPALPNKSSKVDKTPGKMKHVPQKIPSIKKKPLPNHKDIAKQTKTKPIDHPESKGTIEVRPTNFPTNPTRDEIVKMQQHIQHIERTVGKALDLSLSAYAVAELPQATEGRSGVSIGFSGSDAGTGAAVGYSSNFGDKHEYTVKISLSHAGHTDAMGAGFGWQW